MHQRVITIMTSKKRFTYKSAGVDIDAGETLVNRIKKSVSRTHRPEVIGGLGGFGGLFKLALDHYRHPILVSGTDGVGTKLKLALALQQHHSIGIDLVAMVETGQFIAKLLGRATDSRANRALAAKLTTKRSKELAPA